MKKYMMEANRMAGFFAVCVCLSALFALHACKETIDDSNYAIKTDQTAMDFISASPEYSDMKAIYERVRLGDSESASTLANVLSARGHYTCFLPTNACLREYINELTGTTDVSRLSYEQAELIAYNSLIDNGDESAYESPDFPQNGSFSLPALSNRLISCKLEESTSNYLINGVANVVKADNEVTNGMIHVIDHVLAPSENNVAEMIMDAPNMQVMAALLKATTWCDSLTADRDLEYDEKDLEETVYFNSFNYKVADSRYEGYTAFVETDDVMAAWGIPSPQVDEAGNILNADAIVAAVESKCQSVYGSTALGDYANPENPVNRFVAYHVLPTKIAYNRFVHHFNEWNYMYGTNPLEPSESNYTVNVWDYYTTMGNHRGLMKITQLSDLGDREIYINRPSVYANGMNDDYQEIGLAETGEGLNVKIIADNGEYDNNAKNGFYYPIDAVLLYNESVRRNLGSERIRVDLTTIMSEVISNNVRGKTYQYFPAGYFKSVTNESADTRIFYLQDGAGNNYKWKDYQGDEFIFAGVFDFILRLPPVPMSQTYEIRMGLSNNGNRGMAQIYMGDDPQNLLPLGLPVDLRQGGSNNPNIPYVEDGDDEQINLENDKNMRNQGYMKAPKYFLWTDGQSLGTTVRNEGGTASSVNGGPTLRKILTATPMSADKTYYLRFKSSLENREAQFFMDYIEIVPSIVYNGAQAEDIW